MFFRLRLLLYITSIFNASDILFEMISNSKGLTKTNCFTFAKQYLQRVSKAAHNRTDNKINVYGKEVASKRMKLCTLFHTVLVRK